LNSFSFHLLHTDDREKGERKELVKVYIKGFLLLRSCFETFVFSTVKLMGSERTKSVQVQQLYEKWGGNIVIVANRGEIKLTLQS